MTEFRDTVIAALGRLRPGEQLRPDSLLRNSPFAGGRDTQITTAINNINGQLQAGVSPSAIASRIGSGGFMPLMGVAGGTAVISHHSASQSRGEDGRFQEAQ